MPLVLPDLDTRRFDDLALEGRSRIPAHAPSWTDHNYSDPGITLIELLAALVEADVYRANRVPDRNRRKLLALVGERVRGPRAGTAAIVAIPGAGAPAALPAGVEVSVEHGELALPAVTRAALPLATGAVGAVQVIAAGAPADVTTRLTTTRDVPALGDDPEPGCALAVGLDAAAGAGDSVSLHLDLEGPSPAEEDGALAGEGLDPAHHGAVTVWEVFDGLAWTEIPEADVRDETRALSRGGIVALTLPVDAPLATFGAVSVPLAWVRCRLSQGRPDGAPVLRALSARAAGIEFAVPSVSALQIEPGSVVPPPGTVVPGESVPLAFEVDPATGRIVRLVAGESLEAPAVPVLDYAEPTAGAPGRLAVEAAVVGRGDGTPEQVMELAEPPVLEDAGVWILDSQGNVESVRVVAALDASGRKDLDAVLDATSGELRFGDGRRGRVPPAGCTVLARWTSTGAALAGALRPPAVAHLAGGTRNRLLLGGDPSAVDAALTLSLAGATRGAADAEDVAAAAARAERRVWCHERLVEALEQGPAVTLDELDADVVSALAVPERAVTLADHERIALAIPGTRVARARAWAEVHPELAPGLRAAGCVTVVVVPWLPRARPEPTPGLLEAAYRMLEPRRMVGTRVFVAGPTYVTVDVSVRLALVPGADASAATGLVRARLERFLHPLRGGPAERGWPFGRDVYRSEVMQLVDETDGVDHVEDLALAASGEEPACGNLCIPPTALVVAGELDVGVVA